MMERGRVGGFRGRAVSRVGVMGSGHWEGVGGLGRAGLGGGHRHCPWAGG